MDIAEMPTDLEAEQRLLGAVLRMPQLIFSERISPSWFWAEGHRKVWRALTQAVERGVEQIMIPSEVAYSIAAVAGDDYVISKVPVRRYILELESRSVSPEIEYGLWAPRVRSAFIRRLVIGSGRKLAALAAEEPNGDNVIRAFGDEATSLAASMGQRQMDISGHAENWFVEVERRLTGDGVDTTRIPTGIWPIDSVLGGGGVLGHYTIILAQKKMGKSRLTTRIAYNVAKAGAHVLHFSEEMTAREMMWLYVTCQCKRAPSDFFDPKDGKTKQELVQIASDAKDAIAQMPISMHCGRVHVREIVLRAKAKLAAASGAPLVIIVDYLQRIGAEGQDEYARVTNATMELASLAKATGAWVIALSQSKRTEGNRMPNTGDARSSGQIEQDVDEMLIYHRPAAHDSDASPSQKSEGQLWLALNRHGDTVKTSIFCDLVMLDFKQFEGYEF